MYKKNDIVNLEKSEIPNFVNLILEDNFLNNKSKEDFKKKFLVYFLDESENGFKFRKKNAGKFLFWLNKKFIGVIDNSDDTLLYGVRGDDKLIVQISNFTEKKFNKTIYGNIIIKDDHNFLDVFYVNLLLTNKKNPIDNTDVFSSRMLIDTGCTLTDLPNTDYWNYDLRKFVEYPPDRKKVKADYNPKMIEWTHNIKSKKLINAETANETIKI